MSQLDQAKKEAKRLFNLVNDEQLLHIPNLSSSKNIMAVVNGYQNWHEYEEVLKRKDFLYDKVDKNTLHRENKKIIANQEYYIQDIDFNKIEYSKKTTPIIVKQPHKAITLGHSKESKMFDKKKSWVVDSYPLLLLGYTGAGKSDLLASLAKQYIDNQEGCIYFDGKGDVLIYSKIFSYLTDVNRVQDLYCINFMSGTKNVHDPDQTRKLSHTIDPINPMLGNDSYFHKFFGKEIGMVIHAILKSIHTNNQLMDTQSIESILMLHNLIKWSTNEFSHIVEIKDYLSLLGLNSNTEEELKNALEKHAFFCDIAYKTIKMFKNYPHNFKFNCSIDMEDIFLKRKVLLVLMPSLEKSTQELTLLGELVLAQVVQVEIKLKDYKVHTQNIILDEFSYFADEIRKIDFVQSYNNYVFANHDLQRYTLSLIDYIISNSKTYVFMRMGEPQPLPPKMKLDIFENITELPLKNFGKYSLTLNTLPTYINEQSVGQAVVFCKNFTQKDSTHINSEKKYYIYPIECVYLPAKKINEYYLPEHEKIYVFK